jgi:hypothetical protein
MADIVREAVGGVRERMLSAEEGSAILFCWSLLELGG